MVGAMEFRVQKCVEVYCCVDVFYDNNKKTMEQCFHYWLILPFIGLVVDMRFFSNTPIAKTKLPAIRLPDKYQ